MSDVEHPTSQRAPPPSTSEPPAAPPRPPRRGPIARRARVGWPAAVVGVLAVLHALAWIGVTAAGDWLANRPSPFDLGPQATAAIGGWGALSLLLVSFGLVVVARARRLQPGTRGRGRLLVLAGCAVVQVPMHVTWGGLFVWATEQARSSGLLLTLDAAEALLAMPPLASATFFATLAIGALATIVGLGADLGSWFLISVRIRRWILVAVDVALLAAFAAVTATLPLEPASDEPEAMLLPSIRLGVTVLFGLRLVAWVLPTLLDLVEALGFRSLVAARHLRARKSSFLATISVLSVLAVAFSSCSLTITLSVMGGFRNDLKTKILGNNAHVAIEKEHETFEGWDPVLQRTRQSDGVLAASPYVSGEVMVTSASNLAGALLRGVDPETVDRITELEDNLVRGKLEYLVDPEQLLDLPAEERSGPMPLQPRLGRSEPDDEPPPDPGGSGAVGAVDELLGTADEPPSDDSPPTDDDEPDPAGDTGNESDPFLAQESDRVLPGIIVGRELARTLRLYVGDEVNVVSPFGDLGPSGPMPKSRPFRVAGIFYSGMYEYDMKHAYVALEEGQKFLNTGDAISGIDIKVADIEDAPRVAANLRSGLQRGDLQVRDWKELNKNLFGALQLEKLAMFITLGIAILVAGFCVFGTLTLMVQEKAREVAILRAMGTSRRSIVGVFLLEGLLIGLFGAAVGLGLGFVVCYAAEHFGIGLNPEVYYIDKLPVHVDAMEFAWVGISAAIVCLLATLFPAALASRLRPVDALRYE